MRALKKKGGYNKKTGIKWHKCLPNGVPCDRESTVPILAVEIKKRTNRVF